MTVKGLHFENSGVLVCAFGVDIVPASFVDENTLSCITPEVRESKSVSVTVSTNGSTSSSSHESPTFTFVSACLSQSWICRRDLVRLEGGTTLTNEGSGFMKNATMCQFGTVLVEATVLSFETAVCVSPAQVDVTPDTPSVPRVRHVE